MDRTTLRPAIALAAAVALCASGAQSKTGGTGTYSTQIRAYKGVLSVLSWEMKYEGNHTGSLKCEPVKPMEMEAVFNADGSITGSADHFYVFLKESNTAKGGAACKQEFMQRSAEVKGTHKPDGTFQMTVDGDAFSGVLDEKKIQVSGEFKRSSTLISDYLIGKVRHNYKLEIILIRMNGR